MTSKKRIVYADESGYPDETVQSLCLLVGEENILHEVERKLRKVLLESGKNELKFSRIRTSSSFLDLGKKVLDIFLPYLATQKLSLYCRVDADAGRGSIIALYQDVIRDIIKTIDHKAMISFHPDHHNGFKWNTWRHPLSVFDDYLDVKPLPSAEKMAIQVCDLFAGMSRDAYIHRGEYLVFLHSNMMVTHKAFERPTKTKATLLKYFLESSKTLGIPISFDRGFLECSAPNCSIFCLDGY